MKKDKLDLFKMFRHYIGADKAPIIKQNTTPLTRAERRKLERMTPKQLRRMVNKFVPCELSKVI